MEPITAIVTALALGAATGLKPVTEQAIKDSYVALKALITRKYAQVPLDQLEANPSSKSRRRVVEEELAAAGMDLEVLAAARMFVNENRRAEALAALAPHLPEPLQNEALGEALAAVRTLGDEYARAEALAALAPHLPEPLQNEALGEALAATRTPGIAKVLRQAVTLLEIIRSRAPETAAALGVKLEDIEGAEHALWLTTGGTMLRSTVYLGADVQAPEPVTSTLQWNTGFPKDTAVEELRVLFVRRPYLLSTAIQAGENTIGALTPGEAVPPPGEEYQGTTAEGEKYFIVRFGIRVSGAVVQPAGSRLTPGPEAMSDALWCVLGRGTPAFDLELTATAAGPVSLELTLYVHGGAILRRTVRLTAIDLAVGTQPRVVPPGDGGNVLSSQGGGSGAAISSTVAEPTPFSNVPTGLLASPAASPAFGAVALSGERLLRLRPTDAHLAVSFSDDNYWLQLLIDPARYEPVCTASPEEVLVNTVIDLRNELIQLSTAYRAASAHVEDPLAGLRILEPPDALLPFARIGVRLHRALFGRRGDRAISLALHTMAATIAQLGRGAAQPPRMQIDAEFLPIPWAVIYDGPEPKTAAEVDLEAFWGVRFQIDRVARVTLAELAPDCAGARSPRVTACLNPDLDTEQQIAVLQSQRTFFRDTPVLTTLIESGAALKTFLQVTVDEAPCNFLYFFCHATAAQTLNRNLFRDPKSPKEAATIELDKPPLSVEQLCDIRIEPLPAQPLVFMNTCSSAQGDPVFQSVFLTHFFGTWRASGVIGTDWKMPTVFADGFARLFLKYFLIDRYPIADAFHRAARRVLKLGNPFPLIYALYVRPDYTL